MAKAAVGSEVAVQEFKAAAVAKVGHARAAVGCVEFALLSSIVQSH